ncbi:MAG TPA: SDR family NAD(P)-dependent oxidoreductase [Noviherbaspirillum sp.]|nr:SDR family NAD(P)-dependent oxidoreductase [Noviherbaspirillum sp.]
MPFQEKNALITGASQGIGAATARLLRQRGIQSLILLDVAADALDSLIDELRQGEASPRIIRCVADISDRKGLQASLQPAIAELGKIDVLLNNAGIADENEPEQDDIWHRVLNVNLHGTYYVTLEALNVMPDGGRIINVSSVLGRAGYVRNTAYCTSKHALLGFTKSLALDLAMRKITVNAVLPGWVDTPMLRHGLEVQAEKSGADFQQLLRNARKQVPLRRLLESEEVAALIAFLASDEAAGITAQSYVIDGGYTCGM